MKILIIGSQEQSELLKNKLSSAHEYFVSPYLSKELNEVDLVFDFTNEGGSEALEPYSDREGLIVFLNNTHFSLAELSYFQDEITCFLYGFNGEPTFIERDLLEITALSISEKETLPDLMQALGLSYELVDDRVGMVTPRVVAMIINEAYFTVMEGTASREDIDLGMKLGTNYPMGPFEWVKAWGVDRVYELIEALYDDTKDERYKICPLLKKEYLLNSNS